jgi:2TM domain
VGAFLVAIWAFYGSGFFGLVVLLFSWGIAVAVDAWNVYRRKPPPEDQIRREMERMQ